MIGRALAVLALAGGLAAFTYLRLERVGRRGWVAMVCRAIAWAALGLLLLNVSCPVPAAPRRPLVLLDASLSLSAPGARWAEARDSAARWVSRARTATSGLGMTRCRIAGARYSLPRCWQRRRRTVRSSS